MNLLDQYYDEHHYQQRVATSQGRAGIGICIRRPISYDTVMSNRAEIERAIEQLPDSEVEQLRIWLGRRQAQRGARPAAEAWLERARGAARPGVTTESIMAMTRGET